MRFSDEKLASEEISSGVICDRRQTYVVPNYTHGGDLVFSNAFQSS
jgi:hypothetical protein